MIALRVLPFSLALVLSYAVPAIDLMGQDLTAEDLWTAARRGELQRVKQAVESGVDVNAKTTYGATALSFAADRGHSEVADYLLSQRADPNVKDSFYNATPITWATMRDQYDIMKALVIAGAETVDPVINKAIAKEDVELVRAIADSGNASRRGLMAGIENAEKKELKEIQELLQNALEKQFPPVEIPEAKLNSYVGMYQSASESQSDSESGSNEKIRFEITRKENALLVKPESGASITLDADSETEFSNANVKLAFEIAEDQVSDSQVSGFKWTMLGKDQSFRKLTEAEIAALPKREPSATSAENFESANGEFPASSARSLAEDLSISSANWGQFRGAEARGIADGQNPPITWNAEESENLAWKTRIPGVGHSCPVIWDDRLFVTTSVSSQDAEIRTGLYGDVTSVDDETEHEFVTYCLDANSGDILWEQVACKKVPSVKRHLKSTHANSTVATDGQYVVSWFGSEGLYCYTTSGELVWQRDLGLLDSGWFYDRDYQWQFGASPVIHSGRLILLCDIQDQSYIASLDVATGKEIWKTDRDEIPSWSTPTVIDTPSGQQIVTNATGAARGYDFETGEELWQITGNSEIVVPTPFAARGLIFVSSGYRPIQPIYAIRLDARGDLTLDSDEQQSEYVAWSEKKGGPYMPSPIVYGDYLYVCSNSGILACYQVTTGKLVYKQRLRMKGNRSFVSSPVAADGHLYLTSEDGETAVIQAGPVFKLVANNFVGENCLATPAISNGKCYIRGQNHIFALTAADEK